ncbi:MAG TPA: hypothetical protein VFH51_05905 [Myxococcota bacterium]|nr:hypothetical protein [Myxococcota bacterium]
MAVDGQGNIGLYVNGGGSVSNQGGGSVGISLQGSNAKTICDLMGAIRHFQRWGGWVAG